MIDNMKQDRNSPCLCNSGKKFKKCCGSAEAHNKNVIDERNRRIAEREERLKNRNKDTTDYTASMIIMSALSMMSGDRSRPF